MHKSFFRVEAVNAQNSQWLGNIRLASPISIWLIVACSLVFSLGLLSLVSFGTVAKRIHASGSLNLSDAGTVSPELADSLSPVPFEAQLYVPARHAGLISNGQQVSIRLDAYPAQKFGVQHGVVTEVSQTPLLPHGVDSQSYVAALAASRQYATRPSGPEGIYPVKVKLLRQQVLANGKEFSLKQGMTLQANVILEKKRVWEWIVDALSGAAER
jgi:membrane fusion protein